MGRLLVVRHGETESNVLGRYCGSQNAPLNDRGMAQARALAATLHTCNIDVVICSPLLRARQTAAILMSAVNREIIIWDEFRERCVGVYEGLTREEVEVRYPVLWQQDALRQLDFAPEGAETVRELRERVVAGLERIFSSHQGKTVLLVTHGYVSREIHRYLKRLSDEEMHSYSLGNCVVVEYEF